MRYVLNKNQQIANGYHKVHTLDCKRKPKKQNTIDLGECVCPIEAKSRANEYYSNVNGCKYCCREISYSVDKKSI